jgi:hypothetical protein
MATTMKQSVRWRAPRRAATQLRRVCGAKTQGRGFGFMGDRRGGSAAARRRRRDALTRILPSPCVAQLAGVRVNLVAKPRVAAKVSSRTLSTLLACEAVPSLRCRSGARLLDAWQSRAGNQAGCPPRAHATRGAAPCVGAHTRDARIIFSRPNQLG